MRRFALGTVVDSSQDVTSGASVDATGPWDCASIGLARRGRASVRARIRWVGTTRVASTETRVRAAAAVGPASGSACGTNVEPPERVGSMASVCCRVLSPTSRSDSMPGRSHPSSAGGPTSSPVADRLRGAPDAWRASRRPRTPTAAEDVGTQRYAAPVELPNSRGHARALRPPYFSVTRGRGSPTPLWVGPQHAGPWSSTGDPVARRRCPASALIASRTPTDDHAGQGGDKQPWLDPLFRLGRPERFPGPGHSPAARGCGPRRTRP